MQQRPQYTEPLEITRQRSSLIPPALRYPAYRSFWFGMLASVSGFQMFRAVLLWQAYFITLLRQADSAGAQPQPGERTSPAGASH